MAKFFTELNDGLRQFIASQHVFFNASAPNEGRINLSPKGLDTFRILSDKQVAYLDLTGSENETAAHLAENGRLTLMFCSFEDKPLILRLYGKGRVVHPRDPQWQELRASFPTIPGERQIIVMDIESIMSTCGFAVPLYKYKGQRTLLPDWSSKMGEERLEEYRTQRNLQSIDGLPTYLNDAPPEPAS
ncbi:MAG: pyridoxamine 5'-phosphate oxidase family protein [Nitrospira sp.]|nr:pyridoxamine 5'-phosphate oxidase family protein [Nitrospira sp.]